MVTQFILPKTHAVTRTFPMTGENPPTSRSAVLNRVAALLLICLTAGGGILVGHADVIGPRIRSTTAQLFSARQPAQPPLPTPELANERADNFVYRASYPSDVLTVIDGFKGLGEGSIAAQAAALSMPRDDFSRLGREQQWAQASVEKVLRDLSEFKWRRCYLHQNLINSLAASEAKAAPSVPALLRQARVRAGIRIQQELEDAQAAVDAYVANLKPSARELEQTLRGPGKTVSVLRCTEEDNTLSALRTVIQIGGAAVPYLKAAVTEENKDIAPVIARAAVQIGPPGAELVEHLKVCPLFDFRLAIADELRHPGKKYGLPPITIDGAGSE